MSYQAVNTDNETPAKKQPRNRGRKRGDGRRAPYSKDETFEFLRAEIDRAGGGEYHFTMSGLSKKTGVATSTLGLWLKGWREQNRFETATLPGNRGTRLTRKTPRLALISETPADAALASPNPGREEGPPDPMEAPSAPVSASPSGGQSPPENGGEPPKNAALPVPLGEASPEIAKPRIRKRRTPEIAPPLASPKPPAASVPSATGSAARSAGRDRPPFSPLAGLVWIAAFACTAVSVVIVGYHVANTADPGNLFGYWLAVIFSITVSVLKPICGLTAEICFSRRNVAYGFLGFSMALLALYYDATNLLAYRGSGIENKAAAAQASIEDRNRAVALRADLERERAELRAARPRQAAELAALKVETEAKPLCRWIEPRKGTKEERKRPDACIRALAVIDAEKARAERLAALPALIEAADKKTRQAPVIASSTGGADSAAAVLNFGGWEVASGEGIKKSWIFVPVLLVELMAAFGFALGAAINRGKGT